MAIQLASDPPSFDEDDFQEEGDGTEYNMRELMDQIYEMRDVILTIPADQLEVLKKGLITRKAKDNAKTKAADVMVAPDVLKFRHYPAKDKDGKDREGLLDVRIILGPKKSVTILDIRKPNDEF